MKKKTKKVLMGIAFVQSFLMFTSCTAWLGADEGTFVIEQALSQGGGANCVVEAGSGIILAGGVLDLSAEEGYTLALKVTNLLPESADESSPGETNYVDVTEANIYFTDGDTDNADLGGQIPARDLPIFPGDILGSLRVLGVPSSERYSPATGIIFPNTSSVIFVPAITQAEVVEQIVTNQTLVQDLITPEDSKTIIAHIVLKAETGQGVVSFSNEFRFPIKLCINCLLAPVQCPQPGEEVIFVDDLDECIPEGQDQRVSFCGVPSEADSDDE